MKRILLVDDSLRSRLELREILDSRPGWRILEARDGEGTMMLLRGLELPHACVFGLSVGDGAGADLLRRVRAENCPVLRRLPILLSVPAAKAAAVAASSGLDPAFIMTRPFDAAKVVAAFECALAVG
jgi:DNA-binding NarL/FixJ family response regulator